MPIAVFLISLLFVAYLGILNSLNRDIKDFVRDNGDFNSSSNTFVDRRVSDSPYLTTKYERDYEEKKIENIETALIRTCRAISTIAHANSCANWNKASYVWQFVGDIGGSGALSNIYTGSSSSIFDCSSVDDFGRALFKKTIPFSYISGSYFYDLSGVSDANTDACGYSGVVRK